MNLSASTLCLTILVGSTVLACTGSGTAAAEPRLLFSGFGTLGFAVLGDPDAEYRTGRAVDGADDKGSFEVDSRLGLQLDVEATAQLSGTLQGVVREGGDGDPEATLEWAFLRWLPSDSMTLRIGRLALPAYAVSDYREVGYANTLLRPPEDVYSQVPIRSVDGVDASAYAELGETLLSVQLYVGQTDEDFFGSNDVSFRDMLGVNVVAERGPLRVRLSNVSARLALGSDGRRQLSAGLLAAAPLDPALGALAEEFSDEFVRSRFSAIGVSLDFGRVFVDTEYTQRRVDSAIPDFDGWYASLGTRVRAFTPYVFVSAFEGVDERRHGIDLPDVPALAPLEAGLNLALASNDQSTLGLGLRWDFAPDIAFKAQLEQVSGEHGKISTSLLREPTDAAGRGGDVVLGSLAVDFVF